MNNRNRQSYRETRLRSAAMHFLIIATVLLTATAPAISADAVYRAREGRPPRRITGTIERITPTEVQIKSSRNDQPQTVPAWEIVRIAEDGQPSELVRAREAYTERRFEDCLDELQKVDSAGDGTKWKQEFDFLQAAASAELALSSGTVTAQEAGQAVNRFLKTHPESHLKFPAMKLFGRLLFAFGKLDAAANAYEELVSSGWPIYQVTGNYMRGQVQLAQDDVGAAASSFDQAIRNSGAAPDGKQWALLARCQQARCQGVGGAAERAIAQLREIVRQESSDNAELFATAFNALGAIYQSQGKLPEARIEYLKTQLLYANAADAHAEALYWLTEVCGQLNEPERAARAREALKSRYPNSWWASRL